MPTVNLQDVQGNAHLLIFLDAISWSEGTAAGVHPLTKNDGYDVIVSGIYGPAIFTTYTDHPFAHGRAAQIIRTKAPMETSTASGRYQLELKWWRAYKPLLKLEDFSPRSQDLVAIQQIRERKALPLIAAGEFGEAILHCSNIWASFPGNAYGQGGKTMPALLNFVKTHPLLAEVRV